MVWLDDKSLLMAGGLEQDEDVESCPAAPQSNSALGFL